MSCESAIPTSPTSPTSATSCPFTQASKNSIDPNEIEKISFRQLSVKDWPDVALIFEQLPRDEINTLLVYSGAEDYNKQLSKEQLAELWIKQVVQNQKCLTMRSLYAELNDSGISSQNERIVKLFPNGEDRKETLPDVKAGAISIAERGSLCTALRSAYTLLGDKSRLVAGYLGVPAERLTNDITEDAVADLIMEHSNSKFEGISWKELISALYKVGVATPDEYVFPECNDKKYDAAKEQLKVFLSKHTGDLIGIKHQAVEVQRAINQKNTQASNSSPSNPPENSAIVHLPPEPVYSPTGQTIHSHSQSSPNPLNFVSTESIHKRGGSQECLFETEDELQGRANLTSQDTVTPNLSLVVGSQVVESTSPHGIHSSTLSLPTNLYGVNSFDLETKDAFMENLKSDHTRGFMPRTSSFTPHVRASKSPEKLTLESGQFTSHSQFSCD
ncbi:hypothetical protein JQC92_07115 [Shewanella sp. 202IG2-18]|uniref:hypothetical protein n=1 Tax=Parashewanella hymeniacidonis TaxID=2807618 RepID=UPI0019603DEE|nr:hypothetical protein [Parashewanella hymeniacidonis]MBM7071813.1 hypothetical protein [Parashewanella hymeniacidonis]